LPAILYPKAVLGDSNPNWRPQAYTG